MTTFTIQIPKRVPYSLGFCLFALLAILTFAFLANSSELPFWRFGSNMLCFLIFLKIAIFLFRSAFPAATKSNRE